jgi:hypothetical protein
LAEGRPPRGLGLAAAALAACVLAPGLHAAPPAAAKKTELAPAFDVDAPTPHRIAISIDTAPARDLLGLMGGAPDAPATLKRLKGYRSVSLALKQEGLSPDDFFGRLVAHVAGTPDPLLETWARDGQRMKLLLDELQAGGTATAELGARRVASLLPTSPAVAVRLVIVPFFSTAGFAEVAAVPDGDALYLVADLPKLGGDPASLAQEREVVLSLMRAVLAQAWRALFDANFKKPPRWPDERAADFDALLSRTVSDGPATLFLFPDEFSPIGSLLEEPIERSFLRWNRVVEVVTDPKKKESDKRNAIGDPTKGDFWRRYGSIVGAAMTDTLLRRAGREKLLSALADGPRAFAGAYVAECAKDKKLPQLESAAKKALDKPPVPTPTPGFVPPPMPTASAGR